MGTNKLIHNSLPKVLHTEIQTTGSSACRILFSVGVWMAFILSCQASLSDRWTTKKDIFYYPDSTLLRNKTNLSQCRLDIGYPAGKQGFATIVWFHGGGLTSGSKEMPDALLHKGYAVVGVGYRLSPQVGSPTYIEDAAAAVAWVFNHIKEFGGDPRLIFVTGHSAGGYLGLMLTLDKAYLKAHEIDADRIAGLIPFSGQAITHFTIRKERGIPNTRPVVDEWAPLFHVRPQTPPIVLITGDRELELLGRYEENAYLRRMLQLSGNNRVALYELQGFTHETMVEPAFPLLLRTIRSLEKEIKAEK